MNRRTMFFATLAVAMLAIPGTLGSGSTDDREATYIGGSAIVPPPEPFLPGCDTELGPQVGGAIFCDVPIGALVLVMIDTDGAGTHGTITCLKSGGHEVIAEDLTTADFTVMDSCVPHPDDKADTTRIGVFPNPGAITGTLELTFL